MVAITTLATSVYAGDWNSSPNNWQNSPNRYENENLIYNGNGNATGYSVPNSSGGINMYDFEGNRTGYVPIR